MGSTDINEEKNSVLNKIKDTTIVDLTNERDHKNTTTGAISGCIKPVVFDNHRGHGQAGGGNDTAIA